MSKAPITVVYFTEWVRKGILIWQLKLDDARHHREIGVLAVGILISAVIEFLVVLRSKSRYGEVTSVVCYALSGLMPLLVFSNIEQLSRALTLFLKYRDPSLHYLSAATYILLFPDEEAALGATIRVWFFVIFETATFVFFTIKLRRLLIQCSSAKRAALRVTISLLLAIVANYLVVSCYAERLYWLTVATMLEGR